MQFSEKLVLSDLVELSINWDLGKCLDTMVDRITQVTSDKLRLSTGEPMAVPIGPFCEWVMVDFFADVQPNGPDCSQKCTVAILLRYRHDTEG